MVRQPDSSQMDKTALPDIARKDHHLCGRLALALGQDVQEITDFEAISESNAQKLKKISPAGTHHDGSVFLVE
jgi:hypothetical protein